MHQVILQLIAVKWQLFGKHHAAINTALNLLYTLLWTVLGVTLPKDRHNKAYYTPLDKMAWRIVLEIICLSMTTFFSVRVSKEFIKYHHYCAIWFDICG